MFGTSHEYSALVEKKDVKKDNKRKLKFSLLLNLILVVFVVYNFYGNSIVELFSGGNKLERNHMLRMKQRTIKESMERTQENNDLLVRKKHYKNFHLHNDKIFRPKDIPPKKDIGREKFTPTLAVRPDIRADPHEKPKKKPVKSHGVINAKVDSSTSSTVSYTVSSGDYVIIRSAYGGVVFDNQSSGSYGDLYSTGDYIGDSSLWIVGYSSYYGGYYFENVDTGKYLDSFAGDFTTYYYIDAWVIWSITDEMCSLDSNATEYRIMYGQLKNPYNSYCPATESCKEDDDMETSSENCDYCYSLFTFDILSD